MTDRSAVARVVPKRRSPWITRVALLCLAAIAAAIGIGAAPFLFDGATLFSEVAKQVRATTGLVIETKARARFVFLPHPHVSLGALRIYDPSGTLALQADTLHGDVRLLPLLVGRLELSAATLLRPRLTIDLDGRPMPADSMIGRALHVDDGGRARPSPGERLGTVSLVDGTAVLKGGKLTHPFAFTDIDMTLDWPALQSSASLTGSLRMAGTAVELAAWVSQPSGLMRGDSSAATLSLQSRPLRLSANGDVTDAATMSFRGHVVASAPSLPEALAIVGTDIASPAPLADLTLNSDASIDLDHGVATRLDLPNLDLRVDGNRYEGTLAYRDGTSREGERNAGKPSLSATLASDQLQMAPFLRMTPRLTDAEHRWVRTPVPVDRDAPLSLDLRISATHLHLSPVTIDDAALAVMSRDQRMEIALVEGRAYGGVVKGRISYNLAGGELSLRGAATVRDADAAALSWDAFGRQLAAGTLSGSANVESAGDSPAALVAHLQGWAKGSASDGEVSGIDLGLALREFARNRVAAILPALRAGRTPFHALAIALRLSDGVATIDQASMEGPDATLSVSGNANIGTRGLDLHAIAATPDGAAPDQQARLPFQIGGSLDKAVFAPASADPASEAAPVGPQP